MKIKIFNLIRTELHNDTNIWSFPTFKQAQDKMFEESQKMLNVNLREMSEGYYDIDGYNIYVGNDYVTIKYGNVVEYEIKPTTMDTRQIKVETIIDRVMEICPACEKYREMIMDELLCYTEKELPFYYDDIRHFIDTELEERLSNSAAAKIVSGYDEEFQCKYFQVVADYLEGNRGLSVILAVMNGEEDAIEDVKKEINKEQGKDVFNLDYVYVVTSIWQDGSHFDFAENTSLYRSHESASAAMVKAYNEAIEVFNGQYVGENITYWCDDDVYQVYFDADGNYDMWEGKIMKINVQD